MKVENNTTKTTFGTKVPTILSKSKMKDSIETITHVSRNNKLATSSNWMYDETAEYPLVLIKYISTKMAKFFNKLKK